jgi:N-acetylglucosaminyldiphosphoundecaprenol N-acetyl-beta-D-mannosaminyltransferase
MPSVETALAYSREERILERVPVGAKPQPIAKEEANSTWTVITTPRRLDATTVETLVAQCEDSLLQTSLLILDFVDTVFLASAGLAALAKIQRIAKDQNGQMRVANCSEDVKRVIEIVRFDKILSMYKDVPSAMSRTESIQK